MARKKLKEGFKKVAISATVSPTILNQIARLTETRGMNRSKIIELALIRLIESEAKFNNLLNPKKNGTV